MQDFVFTKHEHETCKGNESDKNKRETFELATRDNDALPSSLVVMFDVNAGEMAERVSMATFAAPPTPTAKNFLEYPALFRLSFDTKSKKHHSIRTQLCLAAGHQWYSKLITLLEPFFLSEARLAQRVAILM